MKRAFLEVDGMLGYFLTFMAGLLFGGFLTALVSAQRQEEAYLDGYMKGAMDAKEKKDKSYADWIIGRGEDGEA